MAASSLGAKRIAVSSARQPMTRSVCWSCRAITSRRQFASAATAESTAPQSQVPPVTHATTQQAYQLHAGVVLSRPPQITRDLAPFEKSFYLYQRRLNERLALPFTRYFYIRPDTPADVDWKKKISQRLSPSRDIGVYNAFKGEGWNDELLVGAQESEPAHQIEALLHDAETAAAEEQSEEGDSEKVIERPAPRVTDADKTNNVKSLDRALQRTLYLVVKDKNGRWVFPSSRLAGKERLHQAAERVLVQSAGPNMNTWVVGNAPVGHCQRNFREPVGGDQDGVQEIGEKKFFMKARIFAGQADVEQNVLGLTDFQWLCKEELQKVMSSRDYSDVRNMLAER